MDFDITFHSQIADPCDNIDCGRGACIVDRHEATCSCSPGYVLHNGACQDIDECQDHPCHNSAVCQNFPGSFVCSCPEGLVGDPVNTGCRSPGECFTDSDCPLTAACKDARCTNPCDSLTACGRNAQCIVNNHAAICRCPKNSIGDAHIECRLIECSDNNDCAHSKSCYDSKCVDPCKVANACGRNSNCFVENHIGVCSCQPGTTGNPLLGCVPVQYCSDDNQCLSGTICNSGVCSSLCTSNRDCIGEQSCLQGMCQATCHGNSSCPDFQYCLNNICTKEIRCHSDDDCDITENCLVDSYGRSECRNPCEGRALCGRNAECAARSHQPLCSCKAGFTGDPLTGCRRIECQSDNDCSAEKLCDNSICKIACLVGKSCGENALCSTENHKQVCYCQPGFSGDPQVRCEAVDFCRDAPCGPGANCKNNKGTFHCSCGAGFIGDPYNEGCRLAVECQSNLDCPSSAECIRSGSGSKCRDVCEQVVCGPNSDCAPQDHVAICHCRPGYGGNAADGHIGCRPLPSPCAVSSECPANSYCYGGHCKPSCATSEECALDEICANSQCINPCTNPKSCGMNANCITDNHFKQCTCPPGFTGNSAVECVRSEC